MTKSQVRMNRAYKAAAQFTAHAYETDFLRHREAVNMFAKLEETGSLVSALQAGHYIAEAVIFTACQAGRNVLDADSYDVDSWHFVKLVCQHRPSVIEEVRKLVPRDLFVSVCVQLER